MKIKRTRRGRRAADSAKTPKEFADGFMEAVGSRIVAEYMDRKRIVGRQRKLMLAVARDVVENRVATGSWATEISAGTISKDEETKKIVPAGETRMAMLLPHGLMTRLECAIMRAAERGVL